MDKRPMNIFGPRSFIIGTPEYDIRKSMSPPKPSPPRSLSPPPVSPYNPPIRTASLPPLPKDFLQPLPFSPPLPGPYTAPRGTHNQPRTEWFPSIDGWFDTAMGSPTRARIIFIVFTLCGLLIGYGFGVHMRDANLLPYAVMGAAGGLLFLPLLRLAIKLALTVVLIGCAIAVIGLIIYSANYFLQGH